MDIDEESIVEYSSNSLWERMSQWKNQAMQTYKTKPFSYWILFLLSIGGMLTALPASSLLSRVYNTNGGFLTAAHDLMFAYAYAYLPASSATLLASSSLVFSCLFGYFIVNNKLNASAINSTVIIIAATTIISLDSDTDRYDNVSNRQYISGFIWDVMASALHGLIYALSELVFVKFLGRRSFHVVVEQQTMVSLFAFVFVSIGVIVNGDFEGMKSEAKTFVGGEDSYIKVIVWAAITFQLGSLGATGVVYLGSSVMAGIVNAVRNPITSIVAVVVLNDPMSGLKMMSLLLTLWGFACYIYGNSSSPR
ncbi:probable purine permease 5 isoform X2 [Euphorbia lathyris]|uniref:probable purine permease 5 isoform X2 n=1 Tax=Euphorbia lathyris TaxID=212925 RepID=UPI00331361C5